MLIAFIHKHIGDGIPPIPEKPRFTPVAVAPSGRSVDRSTVLVPELMALVIT